MGIFRDAELDRKYAEYLPGDVDYYDEHRRFLKRVFSFRTILPQKQVPLLPIPEPYGECDAVGRCHWQYFRDPYPTWVYCTRAQVREMIANANLARIIYNHLGGREAWDWASSVTSGHRYAYGVPPPG